MQDKQWNNEYDPALTCMPNHPVFSILDWPEQVEIEYCMLQNKDGDYQHHTKMYRNGQVIWCDAWAKFIEQSWISINHEWIERSWFELDIFKKWKRSLDYVFIWENTLPTTVSEETSTWGPFRHWSEWTMKTPTPTYSKFIGFTLTEWIGQFDEDKLVKLMRHKSRG